MKEDVNLDLLHLLEEIFAIKMFKSIHYGVMRILFGGHILFGNNRSNVMPQFFERIAFSKLLR